MNLFLRFCETAERVGATAKRLEKAAALKDYFETLSDEDLVLAARFFAGQAFSLRDQRTTNIGGAALYNAISAATAIDVEELKRLTVVSGDIGETAAKIFQSETAAGYSLRDVANFIETVSETSGTKAKTALLIDFLKPANNLEAKYIIKILSGDLRIGLLEGAVEDAIARMFEVPVGKVQWTNMLTGDIGETALLFRSGKADTARMRFFHPIKFMLASASDLDDVAKRMPDSFVVEDKFDGIRAQAHVALSEDDEDLHGVQIGNVRVALFSRTLDEITYSFPELVEPLSRLIENQPGGVILDGEILPVKDDRILPFQDLQKRLGRKTVSAEMLRQTPTAFVAYDCLFGDGRILINEPFAARRKILESLSFDNQFARLAESKNFTEVAKLDEEFDAARARGNEG
ncbi:MAG TPA: hypothetical protein VEQ34_05660, partial [Pyrinomonadaceae bacterium]|nr:hypothetical protein [Pyrinomonadaceae bacterium]